MEKDSISVLGRDVLVHIFALLPFKTLLNLMSVCSTWRLYLQDEKVWKKKCLEDFQLETKRDDNLTWKHQYYFFKKVNK